MDDEYARFCSECKDYIPAIRKEQGEYVEKFGICDRVDDPDFCFGVRKDKDVCLYGTPGKRLSLEEVKQRLEESIKNHIALDKSLKRASETVESWPKWKRDATRAAIEIPRQPAYRK